MIHRAAELARADDADLLVVYVQIFEASPAAPPRTWPGTGS